MRPETKERADTIIGSVLRGSFTLYQATAGDMRGERRRWEQRGRERERAGEMRQQEKMLVLLLQTLFRGKSLHVSRWDETWRLSN